MASTCCTPPLYQIFWCVAFSLSRWSHVASTWPAGAHYARLPNGPQCGPSWPDRRVRRRTLRRSRSSPSTSWRRSSMCPLRSWRKSRKLDRPYHRSLCRIARRSRSGSRSWISQCLRSRRKSRKYGKPYHRSSCRIARRSRFRRYPGASAQGGNRGNLAEFTTGAYAESYGGARHPCASAHGGNRGFPAGLTVSRRNC